MLLSSTACSSNLPYHTIEVASSSTPHLFYRLMIIWPDDPTEEIVCQCPGYVHRGRCRHQEVADVLRCHWREGDEEQTEEDICPRCGSATYIETTIV